MTKWCGTLEVTCTRIAGSSERYAGDSCYYCLRTHTGSARCRHCCRLTMSHSFIRLEIKWHSNRIWSPSSDFSVQTCECIAHLGNYWLQGHNMQFTIPLFSFRTVSSCHGLLPRTLGFNPRPVHAGFMMAKRQQYRLFCYYFGIILSVINPSMFIPIFHSYTIDAV
jgi:hypothetical protein